ncbi:hypothetical protein [Arthrobacter bambusae]|uniref:hypothetical protein n=1 Tax=Arthrobacter bambusae TaxID=1338426 RepID=UPI00278AB174|nr:hypothetical protein [Arthrobacter bambusae]MDQ0028431.1 hypothetical protein [Arthrobacter bambusae]MDQ0096774.1 hypothetical protein [Arthrobacter bambusae]
MKNNRGPAATGRDRQRDVRGNERLTALTGVVLLVLSIVEILTVPAIRDPLSISLHLFVGVVLAGPVALKIASTGYRFYRYYSGSPAYRLKGPPRVLPRILSPLLILATVALIASGIGLALADPADPGPLRPLHHASFVLWLVLLVLHLIIYLKTVPGLISADWRQSKAARVNGRTSRATAQVAALAAGVIAAVALYPAFSAWLR